MTAFMVGNFVKFSVADDVVHAVPLRALNYEETAAYFKGLERARDEIRARHQYFFIMCSGAVDQTVPEQRVRALVAQWTAQNPIDGMAIYGMAPLLRVGLTLVMNAANLLRKGAVSVTWVKDEAAARQWIDNRRTQLQLQKPRG